MSSSAEPRGLYEDSDTESLSNELSPTDGYFNGRRNHPTDILVPDPSRETDKAAEAQEEAEATHTSEASSAHRRQSQYTTRSSHSRSNLDLTLEDSRRDTEHTPLIPQSAPPAYSAATAGRSYPSEVANTATSIDSQNVSYNTIGGQGLLFPIMQPEDIGGQPGTENVEDRHVDAWKRIHRRYIRKKFKLVYVGFLVLVLLAILIASITKAVSDSHNKDGWRSRPDDSEPPVSDSPQSCPLATHTRQGLFSLNDPKDFAFIELLSDVIHAQERTYSTIRTSGELHIRPCLDTTTANIAVELSIHFTEKELYGMIGWDLGVGSLMLNTPKQISTDPDEQNDPCVYINATIWIKPHTVLNNMAIDTQTMSIIYHEGLQLTINNRLWMSATVGSVTMPGSNGIGTSFFYRSLDASFGSGSVIGTYCLFNSLSIGTRSGNIDVNIVPRAQLGDDVEHSFLNLKSVNGDIKAKTLDLHDIQLGPLPQSNPYRAFHSTVSTSSGKIEVQLIHGNSTSLNSMSGSINAILIPFDNMPQASEITVTNAGGDNNITVTPSIFQSQSPIKRLYGFFTSYTGNMCITFPTTWEGKLRGQTLSGGVWIDWSSLSIISDSKPQGPYWRRLIAVKGSGEGEISFQETSGSMELRDGSVR